MKQTVLIHY